MRGALAAGEVLTDQARVIVEAIDALPADAEPWVAKAGTEFMLDKAGEHDAKALRELGRRLMEVVDPAAADAEEAKRLEGEERDARAAASITMSDDGHGRCRVRLDIPSLHGQMLRKHLLATASPVGKATSRDGAKDGEAPGEPPLSHHRLGLAFMDYIEFRPEHTIPSAGGVAATVVVTIELDALLGGLKAASLDTGGKISASEARRLACKAGIIPVVLGGKSVVLDVGRKRRFHTEAQRIALGLRDGGCTAHGCDAPPGLCHAHHEIPWSRGGGTNVENVRLLCARHHRRIHDPPSSTPSTNTATSDSPEGPRTWFRSG